MADNDSARSSLTGGSLSLRSLTSAKKFAGKLSASAKSKALLREVKPSSNFWEAVAGREKEVHDGIVVEESRKRRSRLAKSQRGVEAVNQAILDARDVNELSRVASLRIDLKEAERLWRFFAVELRAYMDGPELPAGTAMREAEVLAAAPLFAAYDLYFSPERPRPPSPPNGPQEHFSGPFYGNMYEGQYLPWKRERHGEGEMRFSDGSRARGAFVRDQLHGAAALSYRDGVRTYVGGWRRGQRHGHGLLEATHGVQHVRWEGRWRRGLPNGPGAYTTRAGHAVVGDWRKPRLVHGGRAIRWNRVALRLPEGGRFEGKAELENGPECHLRLLAAPSGRLAHDYGSVEVCENVCVEGGNPHTLCAAAECAEALRPHLSCPGKSAYLRNSFLNGSLPPPPLSFVSSFC